MENSTTFKIPLPKIDIDSIVEKSALARVQELDTLINNIVDNLSKTSNGKNLSKYWKTQDELVKDVVKSYKEFNKVSNDINATNLLKVVNALKAMHGVDISDILPDFDDIEKSIKTATKQIGSSLDSAFSINSFKDAFTSFETLKEYGLDLENFFQHFNLNIDTANLQESVKLLERELNRTKRILENTERELESKQVELDSILDESGLAEQRNKLENLQDEIRKIRREAEKEFKNFLRANNFSGDDLYDDGRFWEYFDKIKDGSLSARKAISEFKTEYAYLLQENFNESDGLFNIQQVQEFENKLENVLERVESISRQISDIVENGIVAKTVENLSVDNSISPSQKDLFANILKDEESLKSLSTVLKKIVDESINLQNVNKETFNSEQFAQLIDLFTKIENSVSSMKQVFVDVGDGEEFSPLLKMINSVQEAVAELSKSVNNIKLNVNMDLGSEASERLNQKVSETMGRQLEAYRKLFAAMASKGNTNKEIFNFVEPQDASISERIGIYKGIIERAEKQFGKDSYKRKIGKDYDGLVKEVENARAAFNRATNKKNTENPLDNLFGKTDLSEVISQLGLIISKLEELSSTALEFKNNFADGFNVTASVEEIATLTNKVNNLEAELLKSKTSSVVSNINDEIKETISLCEKSVEIIKRLADYDNKSGIRREQAFLMNSKDGSVSNIVNGKSILSGKANVNMASLYSENVGKGFDTSVHSHPSVNAAFSAADLEVAFKKVKDGFIKTMVVSFDQIASLDIGSIKNEDKDAILSSYKEALKQIKKNISIEIKNYGNMKDILSGYNDGGKQFSEEFGKSLNSIDNKYINITDRLKQTVEKYLYLAIDQFDGKAAISYKDLESKFSENIYKAVDHLSNQIGLSSSDINQLKEKHLKPAIDNAFKALDTSLSAKDWNIYTKTQLPEVGKKMSDMANNMLTKILTKYGYDADKIFNVQSVSDYVKSLAPDVSEEKTKANTKSSVADLNEEYQDVVKLANYIDEVLIKAINDKTKAFENEKNSVNEYIKEEINDLESLENKIKEIINTLNLLKEPIDLDINPPKDLSFIDDLNTSIENVKSELIELISSINDNEDIKKSFVDINTKPIVDIKTWKTIIEDALKGFAVNVEVNPDVVDGHEKSEKGKSKSSENKSSTSVTKQQNKIQNELKETQEEAEKTRDIISQIGLKETYITSEVDKDGNKIEHEVGQFSFVERLQDGQLVNVLSTYNEETEKWEEEVLRLSTAFEKVGKEIISLDNKINRYESDRDKTLAAHPSYDVSADNAIIAQTQKRRDELLEILSLYDKEEEYQYKMAEFERRRTENTERLTNVMQKQVNLQNAKTSEEQVKDRKNSVDNALKEQLSAWKDIQSIREKIAKTSDKDELNNLNKQRKFAQQRYLEAQKTLKANVDLYDNELQLTKLEAIKLETNKKIKNIKITENDPKLNDLLKKQEKEYKRILELKRDIAKLENSNKLKDVTALNENKKLLGKHESEKTRLDSEIANYKDVNGNSLIDLKEREKQLEKNNEKIREEIDLIKIRDLVSKYDVKDVKGNYESKINKLLEDLKNAKFDTTFLQSRTNNIKTNLSTAVSKDAISDIILEYKSLRNDFDLKKAKNVKISSEESLAKNAIKNQLEELKKVFEIKKKIAKLSAADEIGNKNQINTLNKQLAYHKEEFALAKAEVDKYKDREINGRKIIDIDETRKNLLKSIQKTLEEIKQIKSGKDDKKTNELLKKQEDLYKEKLKLRKLIAKYDSDDDLKDLFKTSKTEYKDLTNQLVSEGIIVDVREREEELKRKYIQSLKEVEKLEGKKNNKSDDSKSTEKEIHNLSRLEQAYETLGSTEEKYLKLNAKKEAGTALSSELSELTEYETERGLAEEEIRKIEANRKKVQEAGINLTEENLEQIENQLKLKREDLGLTEQQIKAQKEYEKIKNDNEINKDIFETQENAIKKTIASNSDIAKTNAKFAEVAASKSNITEMKSLIDSVEAEINDLNIKLANNSISLDSYLKQTTKHINSIGSVFDILDTNSNSLEEAENRIREHLTNLDRLGGEGVKVNSVFDKSKNTYKITAEYVDKLSDEVKILGYTYDATVGKIANGTEKAKKYVTKFGEWADWLVEKWKNVGGYLLSFGSLYEIIDILKRGVDVVREFDTALTEMRKVSDESVASLKEFQKASFDIAEGVGSTALQIQNSTVDFQKLGYSLQDASKLAEDANIYANVGDMEIDEATEHMISSIKAWGSEFSSEIEASEAIIDRYNEIGNNFAISSADIGAAMETSAAALKAGGNTLNQSLGLLVSSNLIQQDVSTTASALKILSLRIRGAKAE